MTTARLPAFSEATARCRESVVFPVPPFWLNMDTMYISSPLALLPYCQQHGKKCCQIAIAIAWKLPECEDILLYCLLPLCLIAGNKVAKTKIFDTKKACVETTACACNKSWSQYAILVQP